MATRDGLAQIWYAGTNGVVTGHTPNADNVASAIIDAYNAHFGTDIQIWTPETKTLQVGDTVPNWNAYEKIELQASNFIKTVYGDDAYIFGEINGNNLNLSGAPGAHTCDIIENGIKTEMTGSLTSWITYVLTPRLENAGYNFDTIEIVQSKYEIGDAIPSWDNFTIVI